MEIKVYLPPGHCRTLVAQHTVAKVATMKNVICISENLEKAISSQANKCFGLNSNYFLPE